MQLKSIKAYGFKSFADKIDIEIKDGITGIVGPNGSGKSNIVDAVKWVLGEQSLKALRGTNSMSDVIFQGSASRKPLTRASVSLVIDNKDHYLNSEYDELEIKRIVYSSGENEYLINGSRVRLKDITDLFLDSGAGKEAFSIISQGKIGEILNSKPEERRTIIEEAAGVLKYKKRKIESLKKLDKTNDNLLKIDLIIKELETNLEPLKEQSIKAHKYQTFKEELESIEISLLINDISNLSLEYETLKKESDILREDIENIESSNSKDDSKLERLKLEILKIEQEINIKNTELLKLTEEISSIEAQKQVMVERKKYEVDDVKLANNIIALQENILSLQSTLSSLNEAKDYASKKLNSLNEKKESILVDYRKNVASKNTLQSDINLKNRLLNELKNKIDIAESNIANDTLLPYSVKTVLNNPRIKGMHGTLGSLIEIEEKYTGAIETVLGFNQNVVICSNENSAKEAINYLKENNLGRVTFYPLNIIKPKHIDEITHDKIKNDDDFIGIASNLVNTKEEYKNIVANQLGNVVVVKNIDAMNRIGKLINYSYRVVTIDGEILHSGGSITGGSKKSNKNTLTEKNNLANLKQDYIRMEQDLKYNNDKLEKITKETELLTENLNFLEVQITNLVETLKYHNSQIEQTTLLLTSKENELNGTENLKASTLDAELDNTLKAYYERLEQKEKLNSILEEIKTKKSELNTELNDLEMQNKKFNSEYNKKVSSLNQIEVTLGKYDIKMDNLLIRLTEEYDITYERAKMTYDVPKDIENSRGKVHTLRREIKELGEVNIGAISEYERINTRYEFLTAQKEDLKTSIDELLLVINEMDDTMQKEFKKTFDMISKEFKRVFSKLFKGGHGEITLTDPDNLLDTGIDIIAEPPGKKLKNISLLSGGEKTLTAIALLFAILNVKIVPFCILDEVEAALDEANVQTFGNYLKDYEHKTQFIVITHKKKTMEYANTLYGITMQESGVSKLVSVKLDDEKTEN